MAAPTATSKSSSTVAQQQEAAQAVDDYDTAASSSSTSTCTDSTCASSMSSSSSSSLPSTSADDATASSTMKYNPRDRIYSSTQLEVMNLLVHPFWIFDYVERRIRWANHAAVEMWNASSLDELLARNYADMSPATCKRLEDTLAVCEQGQSMTDQWTLFPKGQPVTVQLHASGMRMSADESHVCIIFEGIPLLNKELVHETLRGVEMLRHLPMAVCQFDMDGNVMFQNPEASLWSTNNSNQSSSKSKKEEEEPKGEGGGEGDDASVSMNASHVSANRTRCHEGGEDNEDDDNETTSSLSRGNLFVRRKVDKSKSLPLTNKDLADKLTTDCNSNNNSLAKIKRDSNSRGSDPARRYTGSRRRISKARTLSMEELKDMDFDETARSSGDSDNDNDQHDTAENSTPTTPPPITRRAVSLRHRFVDRKVGRKALKDIQTNDKVDLEAMLHTAQGPKWSAIQLRRSTDPVTGERVVLYSAQDKTDALNCQKEKHRRKQKSEFLAIMAHEIRTPLHQVTGFIDLLDQTPLNVEQRSFVKLLKSSAQGLMTVISDVLDYSKLEAGQMKLEHIPYEPLMVMEGSLQAVKTSCEEKNIYLDIEWSNDIPFRLVGDPNRLRQILLNLLSVSTCYVLMYTQCCLFTPSIPFRLANLDDPLPPSIHRML